jgi:hypothetical protein
LPLALDMDILPYRRAEPALFGLYHGNRPIRHPVDPEGATGSGRTDYRERRRSWETLRL